MLRKLAISIVFYVFACYTSAFAHPLDSLRLEQRGDKKFIVHRVLKGDVIATIAEKYAVSESDILSNNPLVSENIFAGQILKIPINESKYGVVSVPPVRSLVTSKLPLAQTVTPPATFVAKEKAKSETIGDITEKSELPAKEDLNSPEYKIYVVASPQTVNQLADVFAIEPAAIIELNGLKSNNLKEGQRVKIPNAQPVAMAKEEPKDVIVKTEVPKPVEKLEPKPQPQLAQRVEIDRPIIKEEPKPVKVIVPEPKIVQINPVVKPLKVENFDSLKVTSLPKKISSDKNIVSKPPPPAEVISMAPAKIEEKKIAIPLNRDSLFLSDLKRKRNIEQFLKMDSAYIHPDGIAYKPFDYKQDNYNYDLFSTLTAEENAIVVPNTNQTAGAGDAKKTHVVKKDETIQAVAKKYGISVTDLINWNGLLTYRIRAGQELTINASRADISPYVRTLPTQKQAQQPKVTEGVLGYIKMAGLAQYKEKQSFARGIYTNAAEKGRFVYLVNRDNFKEHFARVIGPLPAGTPKDVVAILDPESATQLAISKSMMRIFIYFVVVDSATEAKKD